MMEEGERHNGEELTPVIGLMNGNSVSSGRQEGEGGREQRVGYHKRTAINIEERPRWNVSITCMMGTPRQIPDESLMQALSRL
jgi:hypothetical protein